MPKEPVQPSLEQSPEIKEHKNFTSNGASLFLSK